MRDDNWLAFRLFNVWKRFFPELKRKNNIIIRFKGRWKNKFGHIRELKNKNTEIIINSLFKDERIPEYIIDLTLAHELIHYMHGFNSPYPKLYKHPHQGGIVMKELKDRGLHDYIKKEKIFFKNDWLEIYNKIKKST